MLPRDRGHWMVANCSRTASSPCQLRTIVQDISGRAQEARGRHAKILSTAFLCAGLNSPGSPLNWLELARVAICESRRWVLLQHNGRLSTARETSIVKSIMQSGRAAPWPPCNVYLTASAPTTRVEGAGDAASCSPGVAQRRGSLPRAKTPHRPSTG